LCANLANKHPCVFCKTVYESLWEIGITKQGKACRRLGAVDEAEMESPSVASELTMVATILALTATSKLFLIGLPVLVAVEMLEEIFV
jgi:hypothetical protein